MKVVEGQVDVKIERVFIEGIAGNVYSMYPGESLMERMWIGCDTKSGPVGFDAKSTLYPRGNFSRNRITRCTSSES